MNSCAGSGLLLVTEAGILVAAITGQAKLLAWFTEHKVRAQGSNISSLESVSTC